MQVQYVRYKYKYLVLFPSDIMMNVHVLSFQYSHHPWKFIDTC